MANNFSDIQAGAVQLIETIKAEVKSLDTEIGTLNKNVKTLLNAGGGNSNQITQQIKTLETEITKLNATIGKQQTQITKLSNAQSQLNNSSRQETNEIKSKIPTLNQLTKAQNSLGNAYIVLVNKQKKARDEVRRLTVEQGKNSRAVRKAQREYDKLTAKVDKANKSTQSLASKGFARASRGLTSLVSAFGIAGGISIFSSIIKDVFSLTKTFDSLGFALERVAGNSFDAAESQRFLIGLTEDYGVELVSTTERWIKFLAAAKQSGVTLKDTQDIFRTMAKTAGVLGLKTDELTGIYLALEQMLSKGKVTTEELRRQLGERLPGAMGIMANAVGVTVAELDKMLKKGEVLSADALPKFAKAVELAYSLDTVDTIETIVAEQNRLTTSWQLFVKNISEGDSVIKSVFGYILKTLRETVQWYDELFQSDDQKLEERVRNQSERLDKAIKDSFDKKLSIQKNFLVSRERLEKNRDKALLEVNRAATTEEKNIADQKYNEALKALQGFNDERDALIKEYAKNNIAVARDEYEEDIRLQEDLNSKTERLRKERIARGKIDVDFKEIFRDTEYLGIQIKTQQDLNKVLEQTNSNVVVSTAKWALYKKLVEETKVTPLPEDEDGKTKKRPAFKIDAERKAAFELAKLNQQAEIDRFKAIAENEELIIEVRQNARDKQLEEEFKMIDLISNYELDVLKEKAKYEGKTDEQIKNQSKLILQESIVEKLDLNKKYYEDLLDIVKSYNKEELKEIKEQQELEQLVRDEKVIAKRKELESQGVLSSEEINKELVKYKNELYIEDTKNFIKQLIAKKEAELKATDNPELQQALRRQIADLEIALANVGNVSEEASKKVNDFLKKFQDEFFSNAGFDFLGGILTDIDAFKKILEEAPDNEKWGIWATSIMEVGQEAFNFLQQNQQAYFDTQFSNLEKERDIAIAFAGDSATAREEIERQYEEKRREIQQRQAKAEKEQAMFNIAINTAQAIVSTLAQAPGGAIAKGVQAAIIGALGAAQLALVASQPLPEFFRGTANAPEGWAMVDEKRPEIHTDRVGNIKSFGESKANQRWMSAGDKVYTSHEEYFKKELGGVLEQNDILPYKEAMSASTPIVNVNGGIKKEDFVREIRGMRKDIMSKETSVTNIDKNGFYTGVRKQNATRERQNSILKIKGGIV